MLVADGGGSFGLDDDADDDGEDESDDEEGMLGLSGDKRLGRITKTHSIQMKCAITLCENLAEKVGEDGKCANKDFEDIFALISGVLVQVITFIDDSILKKLAGDIVGCVDFGALVQRGKDADVLREKVAELEAKIKALENQQWSLLS